ncbi:F0F1 ATP synthase subunit A [Euryhalocaulis caribicus]|uniref:F0F1 ATP synthase subunit A n=1 Tax=Euryhalocaulis caribicus TaxID=1161401 RepID=UPI0003AA657C|nr:F0F1 ATP synthase subunit A [Euryhalocaulis caribicus]
MAKDPTHQFQIQTIGEPILVGPLDLTFTNSSLFMVLASAAIILLLMVSTSRRALVPGRMQSMAEISYEFVADMIRSTAGSDGLRFFPFVFTLFGFILMANMLGMFPYFFTTTAQIVVTSALALLVFFIVIGYGVFKNGFGFLRVFVPSGVPIYILPFVVLIEVISFISRPVSHSVRLFANMLAGHILLKVFAGFVASMAGIGLVGVLGASLPLFMTVALTALEFLVAFLQAYVFAILTCIYLNDALHPGH